VIETLLGGVFGGLLRLAPEVFKIFDKKNERAHELRMLEAEMEFAKVRGEIAMRQTEAAMTMAEMDTMAEAFKEQSQTAKNAGRFVSAISALVRPTVTYLFLALYAAVKVAAYLIAIEQGGNWKDVLTSMWGSDDLAVFNMIISFWFVGRVYERSR
jgi:ABC-type multidrug transport system fused ATPase/permease subunit